MALGIEKLTPTLRTLAQLITSATKIDANKDSKVDTAEIFGFVQIIVMKVVSIYGSIPAALAELQDVDSAERKELIKVFKEEFDLADDALETLIEDWITVLNDLADTFATTLKHFKTDETAG
jgi:hypothetical protein